MTFERNNCRWLPFLEMEHRHEFGSMIFSVISRMTCGVLGIALVAATSTSAFARDDDAFDYNRLLGPGINLDSGLDGPQEGAWRVTPEANYFRLIKGRVQFGAHSHPLVGACRHHGSIRHRNALLPARRLGH